MEGAEVNPPVLGEHCRLAVRVVRPPSQASNPAPKTVVPTCRAVNATVVELSTSHSAPATSYVVDTVIDDSGNAAADVAAALMPTALSVCGKTGHTAIACTRSGSLDSTHSMFDPDARQCFGLQIILALVQECHKANKPCFLSMGLVDESLTTAVDVLAPREGDPRSVQAVRIRFRPSIGDGSIFGQITHVDLMRDWRPQTVVRQALDVARRHQDKQHCDIFACFTVGEGGSRQCLYLVDVASPQRLRFAMAQHDSLSSPFVDSDTLPRPEMLLPCMLFGVCARSRFQLLHSTSAYSSTDEVEQLRSFLPLRRLVTFPQAPLRDYTDSHALAHYFAAEVHRLRNQVNYYAAQASKVDTAAAVASGVDSSLRNLHDLQAALARQMPKLADPKDRSHSAATTVLRGRLGVLNQLEQEAMSREKSLKDYHDWLLSVRVLEPTLGGAESLTFGERVRLLEETVATQKRELDRLRRVASRDMAVLSAEFGVLRQAMEAKTPLECIFKASLERFAQEASLLSQGDPDLAHSRATLAVQQLTDKLNYDTALFFGSERVAPKLESEACADLFRTCVDSVRRSMGLPIEPPPRFAEPSESFWRDAVLTHYTAQAERYKLRCLADGLALNCTRMEVAVEAVSACGSGLVSAADAAIAQYRVDSRAVALEPGLRRFGSVLAELQSKSLTVASSNSFHTLQVEGKKLREAAGILKLRTEKCRGIVEALRAASHATESLMESWFADDAVEGAEDMAEHILMGYRRAAGVPIDEARGPRYGVAADGTAPDSGDVVGSVKKETLNVEVRLEEIVDPGSSSALGGKSRKPTLKGGLVKRGVFSDLVLEAASDRRSRGSQSARGDGARSKTPRRR
jgi:hypothetical protein